MRFLISENTENENSYWSKYRKFKICFANDFMTFCTIKMVNKDKFLILNTKYLFFSIAQHY